MKQFLKIALFFVAAFAFSAAVFSDEPALKKAEKAAPTVVLKNDAVTSQTKVSAKSAQVNLYTNQTVYIVGEYYNFIEKAIGEERLIEPLINANEAETLLDVLSNMCFADKKTIKFASTEFNPQDYSKDVNKLILIELKGKYTGAERALKVAESLAERLNKEIQYAQKKIENPYALDPQEEKDYIDTVSSQISDLKGDLEILDDNIAFSEETLQNLYGEQKERLMRLKGVLGKTGDEKSRKNVEAEIAQNSSKSDKSEEEALSGIEDMTSEQALEEQAFLYAEISDMDNSISEQKNEINALKAKRAELKGELEGLDAGLKSPARDLKPEDKDKYVAELRAEVAKKSVSLEAQQKLIVELKKQFDQKKAQLEKEKDKYPKEMCESVSQQLQAVESLFKKFVEYKQKVEVMDKKKTFDKAFKKQESLN